MPFFKRSSLSSSKADLKQVFSSNLSEKDASVIADWQAGKCTAGAEPALQKLLRCCPQTVDQQLKLLKLSEEALLRTRDTAIKRHAELNETFVVVRNATERVRSLSNDGPSLSERLVSLKQAHESTIRVIDSATDQVLRPLQSDGCGVVDATKATATLLDMCATALEKCRDKTTPEANSRIAGLLSRQATACRNLHQHVDSCTARRQAAYAKVLSPLQDCEAALKQLKAEKKVLGIISKVESALKKGMIDEKAFDPEAVKTAGVAIAKVAERVEAGMSLAEQDIKSLVEVLEKQEGRTLELRVALNAVWRDVSPSIVDQPAPESIFQRCDAVDDDEGPMALPLSARANHGNHFSAHTTNKTTSSRGAVSSVPKSMRGQSPGASSLGKGTAAIPLCASDLGALHLTIMDPTPIGLPHKITAGYPMAPTPRLHSPAARPSPGPAKTKSQDPLGFGDVLDAVRGSMEMPHSTLKGVNGQSARIAAAAKNNGTSYYSDTESVSTINSREIHAMTGMAADNRGQLKGSRSRKDVYRSKSPASNDKGSCQKSRHTSNSREHSAGRDTGHSSTTAKSIEEEHEEMKEQLKEARKRQEKLLKSLNKLGYEGGDVDDFVRRRKESKIFGSSRQRSHHSPQSSLGHSWDEHSRNHSRSSKIFGSTKPRSRDGVSGSSRSPMSRGRLDKRSDVSSHGLSSGDHFVRYVNRDTIPEV